MTQQKSSTGITRKKVADLIEAEYNPRKISDHDYQQLLDSVKRFGMVDPLIVNGHKDRKNILIGGHQRLKAARELGYEEVPCVVLSLDRDSEQELNIRLNRNSGEWDWNLLQEFEPDQLKSFGFADWEVSFMEKEEEGPDYSKLNAPDEGEGSEEGEEDPDDAAEQFAKGSRKALQIDFEQEDYAEVLEIAKFWRERGAYIGGMVLEHLKAEKEKVEQEEKKD